MWRIVVLTLVAPAYACGIIGPSCGGRVGPVFSLNGEVAAGAIVVHQVQYGTEGSQNDGSFTWAGDRLPDGPKPRLFLTRIECVDFDPAHEALNHTNQLCSPLGMAGWQDGHIVTSYLLTHGRGNPDTLGPTAQYKIWIVGDPGRAVQYTIRAQWNAPVDC